MAVSEIYKTRLMRSIVIYVVHMLMLLLRFKLRELGHQLRVGWLRTTGRRRKAAMMAAPDKLALFSSMLSLTEELRQTIDDSILRALLDKLIYKGNKKMKVMEASVYPRTDIHATKKNRHGELHDKSHETFVKLGKVSPGLSPP